MDAPRLLDAGHPRQPHDQQHEAQPEHRNRPDTLLCLRLHHLAPHLSAKPPGSLNCGAGCHPAAGAQPARFAPIANQRAISANSRYAWSVTFHMGSFLSDLRHSIRLLIKTPGFSVIAIAALALGIGANTAIFSVVNTVLLQPLPYPEPDRIMRIQRVYKSGDISSSTSIPKFMAWKNNNQTFDSMAIYDFAGPGLNLGSGDHPQQVKGIHVSQEYFRVFGVTPAQGRTFLAQEDQPGGPKAALVSSTLWQNRFGSDPSLVGKPIILGGDPYTVVGILPSNFRPDPPADVFIPLQADPNSTNQGHYLMAAGRLKPGVTRSE